MQLSLNKVIIILLIFVGYSNLAIANTYSSIEYNFNYIKNDIDPLVKVDVVFKGEFQDKLVLNLPFKWASASYMRQIKNINVDNKFQIKMLKREDKSQAVITIPNPSNDQIKVTYEIHQKHGNPIDIYEVMVRDDLVHAPGYGIFAIPEDLDKYQKINVMLNWVGLDPKWKTLSSYGSSSSLSMKIAPHELLNAVYVAGNIRMYNIGSEDKPILSSLYGNFDFKDQEILDGLKEIINSQRTFFSDFDFSYYAISLIEGGNASSMMGTCVYDIFVASLPHGRAMKDYYTLFAHEYLHNWIGIKIGTQKDEELSYWFTEGFTDFYSRLIALRSKGIDRDFFIDEINKLLRLYYLSPVNTEPNSRIKKDFWNDYNIEKLPYYRGLVFALYLNNLIQMESLNFSLDDVMYDLLKASKNESFSSDLFKDIVRKYVKKGIDEDIANIIDKGNIISLEKINLPMQKMSMGRYYLGFDRDFLGKYNFIENIDVKSNAYKAGLRNGQDAIRWEMPKGNAYPDQIVTIKTKDGIFKFNPQDDNKIEIYQLKTDLSPQEEKQFNKFFGVK